MHSQWKTKIIGGRLVTVPIHYESAPIEQDHPELWVTKSQCTNNRIEAHRNKQRALKQLHSSVLDPQDYCISNVEISNHSNYFLEQDNRKNQKFGMLNTQKQFSSSSSSVNFLRRLNLAPRLRFELENELYLLNKSKNFNTNNLHSMLRALDKYQTGKLYFKEILQELDALDNGLNLTVFFETMQYCNFQSNGLIDYEIFMQILSELQPTYLPPIDVSNSPKVFPYNTKKFNKLPESSSNENILSSHRLEDFSRIPYTIHQNISVNTSSTNKYNQANDLLKILPPVQNSESNNVVYGKNSETYSLERLSPSVSKSTCVVNIPCVSNSPCFDSCKKRNFKNTSSSYYDKTNRKLWIKDRKLKSTESLSDQCWWKKSQIDDSIDDVDSKARKGWSDSEKIKTVKGKIRRDKVFIEINNTEKKNLTNEKSHSDSECHYTSDINSDFYTTTDIEITLGSLAKKKIPKKTCFENVLIVDPISVLKASEPTNLVVLPKIEKKNELVVKEDEKKPSNNQSIINEEEEKQGKTSNNKLCNNALKINMCEPTDLIVDYKNQNEDVGTNVIFKTLGASKNHDSLINNCVHEKNNLLPKSVNVEVKGITYTLYPSMNLHLPDLKNQNIKKSLSLEWIYGFSGSNIFITSPKVLVFPVCTIVVLLDPEKKSQVYYRKHTHNITCFCVEKNLVASAQNVKTGISHKGVIYIWNSVKLNTVFKIHTKNKVCTMRFLKPENPFNSSVVNYIATIQENDHNKQLLIYNVSTEEIVYHMELKEVADENNLTSGTYRDNGDFLVGDCNGNIYESKASSRFNGQFRINHIIKNAHSGPISSLVSTKQAFITGSCKDLQIKLWDKNQIQVCLSKMAESCVGCLTLCLMENLLYVATVNNSIISLAIDIPLPKINNLCEGHADEIVGICPHISYGEICYSLSSDGSLNMYNVENKVLVWSYSLKGNGSCMTVHPCKDFLFIGCLNGSIHVLDSCLGSFIEKFKNESSSISCLQFSKDGVFLASGHMNGKILVYDYNNNCVIHRAVVSEYAISSIDWCMSKNLLRVQTHRVNLICYSIDSSSLIEPFESIEWETNNCSISYETSGLWSTKGYKANKMCVLQDHSLITFCTEQLLCLVTYPYLFCNKGFVQVKSLYGSGQVKQIMLSSDCTHLFLCFNDGCLWQWKIKSF
ncbi:echinoderm microtubule-associated protein-like 4 isoform X2 [Hydra vulgaris]|uniref:echinoderm microtubule-associated protein-like 4 isoform X2 n=1 Tax=Hydra vulgaris TaxID=6087 RepID=UPI001F5E5813|nr:echinoderm microtubule-associated protein-like 4 isoform X2 [Hydra vulgaris]